MKTCLIGEIGVDLEILSFLAVVINSFLVVTTLKATGYCNEWTSLGDEFASKLGALAVNL